MALVIFWMFLTDRIRCFTAHRASEFCQARLADPWLSLPYAQQRACCAAVVTCQFLIVSGSS